MYYLWATEKKRTIPRSCWTYLKSPLALTSQAKKEGLKLSLLETHRIYLDLEKNEVYIFNIHATVFSHKNYINNTNSSILTNYRHRIKSSYERKGSEGIRNKVSTFS